MATEFKLNYTGAEINEKLAMVDETKNTLANYYYTSIDIDNKFSENESQTNIKFDDVNSKLEEVDIKFGQIDSEFEEIATKTDEYDSHLESIDNKLNENDTTFENINTRFGEINSNLLLKADLVDGKVPAEQLPDDIGGGASSWNDLEDKPFEDTRVMSYYSQAENPNPVSFDNSMVGYSFYKVSDLIPTRDEIFNSIKVIVNGSVYKPKESEIELETDDFVMTILDNNKHAFIFINKSGALSFTYQGYQMTLEVPEAGIYYVLPTGTSVPSGRIIEIILSGELKTLDKKYLPSGMSYGCEEKPFEDITWDGTTDGLISAIGSVDIDGTTYKYIFYKVSDTFIPKKDIIGAEFIESSGNELGEVTDDYVTPIITGSYITTGSGIFASIAQANDVIDIEGVMTVSFPEIGIYFVAQEVSDSEGNIIENMVLSGTLKAKSIITQIDEKFIPDTIARQIDLDNIDLSAYYTKSEVDTALDNVSVDLSGYYTKSEVDEMLGDIDTVINEINTLIGE